jgi:hypothetical protein
MAFRKTIVRDINPPEVHTERAEVHEIHEEEPGVVHRHVVHDYNDEAYPRSTATAVVYYILSIIEIILAMRLVFRLLGANPGNPFVSFIYGMGSALIAPFAGILPSQPIAAGAALEWSTIIAMLVYAIVAYLVIQLIRISRRSLA